MATIYCCRCRSSLPVIAGESAQICTNFKKSISAIGHDKETGKTTKQGPVTAVGPQRKAVCSKIVARENCS